MAELSEFAEDGLRLFGSHVALAVRLPRREPVRLVAWQHDQDAEPVRVVAPAVRAKSTMTTVGHDITIDLERVELTIPDVEPLPDCYVLLDEEGNQLYWMLLGVVVEPGMTVVLGGPE